MKGVLTRLCQDDKQTLSEINFYDGVDNKLTVKALELPDRNNANSISRIPAGRYRCELRWSQRYGWHFWVKGVDGRTLILIHVGNYYTDTRGCILVGNSFGDINNDGYPDILSSRKTLKRILDLPGDEFELIIIDE